MHKVLIVDDEEFARDFIAELVALFLPDSFILKIDNPQTALNYLLAEDYDILFLDICMPGMTGLELVEKIAHKQKQPYTVLVSAHREFDYAQKGIGLGVKQYLTKPLYKKKVYETIQDYLKRMSTKTIEILLPQTTRHLIIEQIAAIQTVDRTKVKIYMIDSVIQYAVGSLIKMQPLLPPHFQYIRRNCILNYHTIADYNLQTQVVTVICRKEKIVFEVSRNHMKELTTWINQIY